MNQARQGDYRVKLRQSLVLALLHISNTTNKCVQVLVVIGATYVVVGGLARVLDILRKVFVEPFYPNVIS
jgi:hypothetical protein